MKEESNPPLALADLMRHYPLVIARFRELFADVETERATFPSSFQFRLGMTHGIDHWTRVGLFGLEIAQALRAQARVKTSLLVPAGALESAVLWAAFFHDCARQSEGGESAHGREGEKVWRHYAERKKIEAELRAIVSQALLFHVDHPHVDPLANEVTMCLCNADRLDLVRLGEGKIRPDWMYADGVWPRLQPLAKKLLAEVKQPRVKQDLGWA